MAFTACAVSLSCGNDGAVAPDPLDAVASLTVSADSLRLAIGVPLRLRAEARNGRSEVVDASLAWSSSDEQVATVDSAGVVTAIAPGAVRITARVEGVSDGVDFDAFDPNPPIPPSEFAGRVVSNREVELTWLDGSNSETAIVVRRERIGPSGSGPRVAGSPSVVETTTLGPNTTRFVDTALTPETEYRYAIEACNPAGCTSAAGTVEVVTFPTLELNSPGSLPDGFVGAEYAFDFGVAGPAVSWAVVDGELPPGLVLSSEGRLEGSPTATGAFTFTVQVSGGGQQAEAVVAQRVWIAPEVVTVAVPSGIVGQSYVVALQATGGDGMFQWQVVEGFLPPGLTFSSGGSITGTPTSTGRFPLMVEVETVGVRVSVGLELEVFDPLAVETSSVSPAVIDTPYSESLVASGGDGVYSWSLVGGALPAGLALSSAGLVTGTPSVLGSVAASIEVRSGDGQVAAGTVELTVDEQFQPPVVTTSILPEAGVGAAYSITAQAVEGNGVFQWAVASGSLPPGLTLQGSTGRISGTPGAAGSFPFRLRVSSAGLSGTADVVITVWPALAISTTSLPTGVVGQSYGGTLVVSGGDGAPTFDIVAGGLPGGLSLDPSTGEISGSPSASGSVGFTVEVVNAVGQRAERALSITSYPPASVVTASLPDGAVSSAYSEALAAAGGDGSYTWSLLSGSLPPGIALSGTGLISGSPTTAGVSSFTVRVATGDGQTASKGLSITIAAPPPTVTTSNLPVGMVGSPYSFALSASGGDGSYAWDVVGGALPTGVGLAPSTGLLSGTPSASGVFNVTVEVTSAGQSATRPLALIVSSAPVELERSYLPGGYPGIAYSATPESATGGSGSYVYSVSAGALPAGLSLDTSTGAISGVPTSAGMSFFELTATSAGTSASVVFGLTISTVGPSGLNVFGVNVADVIPSATTRGAIDAALARYEQVLTGDAPDYVLPSSGLEGACLGRGPLLHGQTVDDIVVLMDIGPIDGPGGIAGQAGLCGVIRSSGPYAVIAQLILDSEDLDGFSPAVQFALVWHEIGHGFGLIEGAWVQLGLMTGENGPAPEYIGPQGVTAFQSVLGGSGNPPIEADGGGGTRDSHWDEGFFDSEMMTGFLDPVGNALSALTIAALGDLGWPGANLGAADAYSIPGCSPACTVPAPASGRPPGTLGDRRVPLLDDVIREDLWVRQPDGSLRRISWPNPGG